MGKTKIKKQEGDIICPHFKTLNVSTKKKKKKSLFPATCNLFYFFPQTISIEKHIYFGTYSVKRERSCNHAIGML